MIKPYTTFSWSKSNAVNATDGLPMTFAGQWFEPNMGRAVAQAIRNSPEGQRAVIFNGYNAGLFANAKDRIPFKDDKGIMQMGRSLWFDNGIAEHLAGWKMFCEELVAEGVTPDMFIFDGEAGVSCWTQSGENLQAIIADPRYAELAKKYDLATTFEGVWKTYTMWNYNVGRYQIEVTKKAVIDVILSYFPSLKFSDFGDAPLTQEDSIAVPEFNGHNQPVPKGVMNVYSPVLYSNVGQYAWRDARLKQPWWVVAWQVNLLRGIFRADPDAVIMPWIASREMSNVLDTAHWNELMWHACITCGPQFLWFNHTASWTPETGWVDDEKRAAVNDAEFDLMMNTFKQKARGLNWKKSVKNNTFVRYDTTIIVSQCQLEDGSFLGRVTWRQGEQKTHISVNGKSVEVIREAGGLGGWFVGK